MKGKKKARSTTDNSFAPLASSNDPPKALQKHKLTRSDASEPKRAASRSPSPSPSTTSTTLNYTVARLKTYPSTWDFPNLSPTQLARCGLAYVREDEACFCPVCELAQDIYSIAHEKWGDEELLSLHDEDCVLADSIHDMVFSGWHDTPAENASQTATPTSYLPTPTTPESSPKPSSQCAPTDNAPSATPTPISTAETITISSKSSHSPASPQQPSYAAVAASPRSQTPETHLKTSATSNTASRNLEPTTDHSPPPSTPSPSPSTQGTHRTQSSQIPVPSPVLSIYDLEQRFRNRPSPISLRSHNQGTITHSNIGMVLPRLLHAIADLFQTCVHENGVPHQPQLYMAELNQRKWPNGRKRETSNSDEWFQK
jgi:hypothetical protein